MSIVSPYLLIPLILGYFAPLAGSFLSRAHWPGEVTALLTTAVTVIIGFASEWFQSGDAHYNWKQGLLRSVITWLVAAQARQQTWRGTDTDAKLLAFPRKLPPGGVQPGHLAA